MRKLFFAGCAVLTAVSAFAADVVKNVSVHQQWPWSNKVVIEFEIDDPDGLHDVSVTLKNGTAPVEIAKGSLTGDLLNLEGGKHRLVWDPSSLGASADKVLADFTATVELVDDTTKYMVVDISGGSEVASVPVSFASHPPKAGWAADAANYTTKLVLRRIDAGKYQVGSPESEVGRVALHEPQQNVTLTKSYYLALFPTTNKQYERMAGARPAGSDSGDDSPVYMVSLATLRGVGANLTPAQGGSWPNAGHGSFFSNFNARVSFEGDLAGYQFDIPSGAQWEIACRAGTTNTWYNGLDNDSSLPDFSTRLGQIARYNANRTSASTKVASRQPNPWGFYDFIGNTREWVRDFFPVDYSITDWRLGRRAVDGAVWRTDGGTIVCAYTRGGWEWCDASTVRTARWTYVGYGVPTTTGNADRELGFRIVCTYLP